MPQESPELAAIDDTLAALIGIRYAISAIAQRSGHKLTAEDRDELMTILNLANAIQDAHLTLRTTFSRRYQELLR